MSVYKEGYSAVELIKSHSRRIFNDACDWGAPTKSGDKIWNAANQLCKEYGVKGSRVVNKYLSGRSVKRQVILIDEWAVSDEIKTIKQATEKYEVTFVSCTKGACNGYDGYITIVKL